MTSTAAVAPAAAASVAAPARRRLLMPLATLVAAAGIAVASGATFSTSTASTGVVASGTLTQVNSNTVAFSKSNLKPGDVVTGTVKITNSGTLPAAFTLTEAEVTNTFAPKSDVQLVITQNGAAISSAPLGAAGAVDLGVFAAGEARDYGYTVTFSSGASNAQQGKGAETRYTFSSVQTEGESFTGTQGGTSTTAP